MCGVWSFGAEVSAADGLTWMMVWRVAGLMSEFGWVGVLSQWCVLGMMGGEEVCPGLTFSG